MIWGERLSIIFIIVIGLTLSVAAAEWCWEYIKGTAINPQTWNCTLSPPSGAAEGDPSQQTIMDSHYNWHCTNGPIQPAGNVPTQTNFGTDAYGRAFLAMHKQMIYDFDIYREQVLGIDRIEIWDVNNITDESDPDYNPMPYGIPGTGVSATDANAIGGSGCIDGPGRKADISCPTCSSLYNQFRHPSVGGTIDSYTTAGSLGDDLDGGSVGVGNYYPQWHNS